MTKWFARLTLHQFRKSKFMHSQFIAMAAGQSEIRPPDKVLAAKYQEMSKVLAGVPAHAKKAQVTDAQGHVVSETYYFEPSRLDHYA